MNKQKGAVIVWAVLIIVILIIVGGVFYFQNTKSSVIDSSLIQIQSTDYLVSYSPTLFSEVHTNVRLPRDYTVGHQGIKLIDPKYASKIGKKECSSGEVGEVSGLMRLCTAENQPGITFLVLSDSINNVTSVFQDFGTSDQVIEGKTFITSSIGAEGSGVAYYFYSLSSNKTLVIVRNIVENDTFIPSDAVFNQVISTLTVR